MNNPAHFQIIPTIKAAWNKVKGAKAVFWAVLCLVILVRIVQRNFSHLQTLYSHEADVQLIFLAGILITTILSLVLDYGLYYMGAQRAIDLPIRFNMLRQVFAIDMLFKIIGNVLLNFLILLIPALILIGLGATFDTFSSHVVWGICFILAMILTLFLMIRLCLSSMMIAVEKATPWRAVKRSFQATHGYCWKLFWLFIVNVLILIISAIPLGIGLIWTLPYFFINRGVVYQKLASGQ